MDGAERCSGEELSDDDPSVACPDEACSSYIAKYNQHRINKSAAAFTKAHTEALHRERPSKVTINVYYRTWPGQDLFIVGSIRELGAWQTSEAKPMKYIDDGRWTCEVEIAGRGQVVEFKTIVTSIWDREVLWEPGYNHKLNINDRQPQVIEVQWGAACHSQT